MLYIENRNMIRYKQQYCKVCIVHSMGPININIMLIGIFFLQLKTYLHIHVDRFQPTPMKQALLPQLQLILSSYFYINSM